MSLTPPTFDQAEYLGPPAVPPAFDSAIFLRAIAFGIAGAIAGAIVYAAFIGITHIQIGYLSIGVAYLVAKAMTMGSNGRGGRPYQVAALILTCLAVAFGNSLLLWWEIKDQGILLSPRVLYFLGRFGLMKPFLEFQHSPGGAILGLFILFIGLRAAWRMTSGEPGAVRHPFAR
ncbi:hypothetical protein [Granulicella mallensis]|uniref:Uncharacterized protein n=1 Tax=Granulicella mallensis (strain ATCC BAA-1857 / DSM 23137 / MP5ACTX8) TaxID=682795 RepID=G8NTB9_GRAMM|nr:hypothetical protein [Granulicella mallensis]AEU38631.1 hypothetical protein AciX8_4358 [Granulicella mallensis MP5ACTX8]